MSRGPPRELSQSLASLGHAGCGQPESAELTLDCVATVTHHVGSEPKRAQAEEAEREKNPPDAQQV